MRGAIRGQEREIDWGSNELSLRIKTDVQWEEDVQQEDDWLKQPSFTCYGLCIQIKADIQQRKDVEQGSWPGKPLFICYRLYI